MGLASDKETSANGSTKTSDNVKSVEKDVKVETKSNGFFKLKSWKTTLIIVGVSLILRSLIRPKQKHEISIPLGPDEEPFLTLVPEKYDEKDLFKWTPAPAPVSKPDEPGDMSNLVEVPEERKEEAKQRFAEHQFNVVANEMMSFNRSLIDARYPECLYLKYPKKLPQVSVIIVYHQEAWSTLIRTVWSVITQTPRELLKEIILVDDFSTKEHLGRELQDYVKKFPVPVILAKTIERVGLIQARLLGASKATASIMVFLDAHCECNQGWLEALISPIAESRTTVTTPIIDVIDFETMGVKTAVINTRGSFDLGLSFTWDPIPKRQIESLKNDRTAPIMAPAMAGGLFAIDREYFYKLGAYDEKMKIWGGENLEMSVRLWTCGGKLITIPCSRVAHIFRQNSPYVLPGGANHVVGHNLARMVDVWFDEYKDFYYTVTPNARKERTDVTERKILRKQLKCKPFEWYLKNIFPESPFNAQNYRLGEIETMAEENMCLDSMGPSRKPNRSVEIQKCHRAGGNQIFMITERGEIQEKKFCMDATKPGAPVKLLSCHGEGGNQIWFYDSETNEIRHRNGDNCLTLPDDEDSKELTIEECDGSAEQQWYFRDAEYKSD